MTLKVAGFMRTGRFQSEWKAAPLDVQNAARDALAKLQVNPSSRVLRLHTLSGFGKPSVWKIDVFANKSWQITFEMDGEVAKLCRLARHRRIDNDPRS